MKLSVNLEAFSQRISSIELKKNYYHIYPFHVPKFQKKLQKYYGTSRIGKLFQGIGILKYVGQYTLQIHQFFIPELVYLMQTLNYPDQQIDKVVADTWINVRSHPDDWIVSSLAPMRRVMNVKLLPHQQHFVENYRNYKTASNLNGYILSFDQGLGKTLTSLAISENYEFDRTIIIAPKSTLHSVWEDHLQRFFKTPPTYWVARRPVESLATSRYVIINYEGVPKLLERIESIASGNTCIILDESHNFLDIKSKRTQNLITLREQTNCTDVLMMSGTPIKAVGSETIPMLKVLDPLFDDDALRHFKEAFGVTLEVVNDILRERLSTMMHRKLKTEVLTLPEKTEATLKIKIPNGREYTIDSVRSKMLTYSDERHLHHRQLAGQYEQEFHEVLNYLSNVEGIGGTPEFIEYVELTEWLHQNSYNAADRVLQERVAKINVYEKTVLRAALPPDLRKQFDHCVAAYKYINLKVMGETLGYLGNLRSEMTAQILTNSSVNDIIENAEKKTVLFTSYAAIVEIADTYVRQYKYNPILVYGKTAKNVSQLIQSFVNDPETNPLIASLHMLSTGVTLTVANTVVFLNLPWRSVEYSQASDRVHRIGQDADVEIYTLILDTGEVPNLSTRMEDIVSWSKDQFGQIVGDDVEDVRKFSKMFERSFGGTFSHTLSFIQSFWKGE